MSRMEEGQSRRSSLPRGVKKGAGLHLPDFFSSQTKIDILSLFLPWESVDEGTEKPGVKWDPFPMEGIIVMRKNPPPLH